MGSPTSINLNNAGLFSALAYAPDGIADSMAWALTQSSSNPVYQDATMLQSEGWYDVTASIGSKFDLLQDYYYNPKSESAFHIYENYTTKQIVFAFRGSISPATSLKNWAADLTLTDEGYSTWAGIEASVGAAFTAITNSSQFAGYQYAADGHSLGGGLAQTFAVADSTPSILISGFAENSLPISPVEAVALQTKLAAQQTNCKQFRNPV